jgi:hypothetical protein
MKGDISIASMVKCRSTGSEGSRISHTSSIHLHLQVTYNKDFQETVKPKSENSKRLILQTTVDLVPVCR